MSIGAPGDGLLRCLFEGCLSDGDMGIQRRPYHRNCRCALHKSTGHCSHRSRYNSVAYPIRRSWSEGSLALNGNSSPVEMTRSWSQSARGKAEEDEEVGASPGASPKV